MERIEDEIYRDLGRFVVFFQTLENELLLLASFALDPEHRGHGRHVAAGLPFGQLVSETWTSVGRFLDKYREDEPEFREKLRERLRLLLDQCRELARYRNKVVHSAYLFLEAGDELVAIVRSDMRRGAESSEVALDQEPLSEGSFDEAMHEIAEVAFGIGQCRLQLIHWYKPERGSGGEAT
jgi:hypothetical protein